MQKKPFLVVTGPTASGKSDLALQLAKKLNGEIINIDSVQVYKGFDIGSAKLPVKDRGEIEHHLIDIFEPDKQFNAGEFTKQAVQVSNHIQEKGKLPIYCGGTTMYVTHLIHGLAPLPRSDQILRQELEALSNDELHQRLKELDPHAAAKLHRNDRVRVVRAIETTILTGKSLSQLLNEHSYSMQSANPGLIIVVCWAREELYERINRRAEEIVKAGILDETKSLISRYGRDLPALSTLGYKQACDVIDQKLDPSQLVSEIALHTRHFAKRQMTYFRNEPAKRGWSVRPGDDEDSIELASQPSIATMRDTKHFRALDLSITELHQQIATRLESEFKQPEAWLISGGRM